MGKGNFSDEFKRDAVAQITEPGYQALFPGDLTVPACSGYFAITHSCGALSQNSRGHFQFLGDHPADPRLRAEHRLLLAEHEVEAQKNSPTVSRRRTCWILSPRNYRNFVWTMSLRTALQARCDHC